MNAIDTLDAQVKKMISSREAFIKHFTREDIVAYIDYLINNHMVVVDSMKLFGDMYMRTLAKTINDNKEAPKAGYIPYINYKKFLKGKALSLESTEALSSIKAANENYIIVLNELKDNLVNKFKVERLKAQKLLTDRLQSFPLPLH